MHTDDHKDPLVELGYETRDIDAKVVFRYSMGFFAFAFAAWFITLFFFSRSSLADHNVAGNNWKMSSKPAEPNPILQTNITAKTDIRDMRKHEKEELTTSGPSEHGKGTLRIPIEQAIKLTAERKGKVTPVEGLQ